MQKGDMGTGGERGTLRIFGESSPLILARRNIQFQGRRKDDYGLSKVGHQKLIGYTRTPSPKYGDSWGSLAIQRGSLVLRITEGYYEVDVGTPMAQRSRTGYCRCPPGPGSSRDGSGPSSNWSPETGTSRRGQPAFDFGKQRSGGSGSTTGEACEGVDRS